MFEKSFEEALRIADSAERLDQSGAAADASNKAVKTSETVLTNSPQIFTLAIGWQSSQVGMPRQTSAFDEKIRKLHSPGPLI